MRHGLANFKARLKALEAKIAEEGIVLTEAQVQALEKKKLDDEAQPTVPTTSRVASARVSPGCHELAVRMSACLPGAGIGEARKYETG